VGLTPAAYEHACDAGFQVENGHLCGGDSTGHGVIVNNTARPPGSSSGHM